jgi:hypothetical protein
MGMAREAYAIGPAAQRRNFLEPGAPGRENRTSTSYDLGVILALALLLQDALAPEALVERLGVDDPAVRAEAERRLVALGRPAIPCLERALRDADPEIAGRARDVLAALRRTPELLPDVLRDAVRDARADLPGLARALARIVPDLCLGRDWRSLRAPLEAAGGRWVAGGEYHRRLLWRDLRALERVHVLPGGAAFDLVLKLEIEVEPHPGRPTLQRVVRAEPWLVAPLGGSREDLLRQAAFPPGSVPARLLASPAVAEPSATLLPRIDRLELLHARIHDRWSDDAPWGLHAVLASSDPLRRRDAHARFGAPDGTSAWRRLGGSASLPGTGSLSLDLVREDAAAPAPEPRLPADVAYSTADLGVLPEATAELVLDGPAFEDGDLAALARLRNLRALGLGYGRRLRGRGLDVVAALPRLHKLVLPGESLEPGELARLEASTSLRDLEFHAPFDPGPTGFAALGRLDRLTSLRLRCRTAPRPEDWATIGRLVRLRRLVVSVVDDAGAPPPALASLHALEELELRGFGAPAEDVAAAWAGLPRLRSLELVDGRLDDAGLGRLLGAEPLEALRLYRCGGFTPAGVSDVARLARRRELVLSHPEGFQPADLAALRQALGTSFLDR